MANEAERYQELKVPLDLSSDVIAHAAALPAGIEDSEIAALTSTLRDARSGADSLVNLVKAVRADPTLSQEAAAMRVRQQALRVAQAATKKLDISRARAAAALDAHERATRAPAAPSDAVALALEGEIRSSLRWMKGGRDKVIADAFDAGDKQVIGAVLRGPSFLSGSPPAKVEWLRERYRREFFPKETEQADRRKKALDAFDRAGGSFVRFVKRLTDDPLAMRAEDAKTAREQAEQDFIEEEG